MSDVLLFIRFSCVQGKEKYKIFVGGLSDQTTDDTFKQYFSAIGDLLDAKVMFERPGRNADPSEQPRPRGFGFVTFSKVQDFEKCLNNENIIDGRKVS